MLTIVGFNKQNWIQPIHFKIIPIYYIFINNNLKID